MLLALKIVHHAGQVDIFPQTLRETSGIRRYEVPFNSEAFQSFANATRHPAVFNWIARSRGTVLDRHIIDKLIV